MALRKESRWHTGPAGHILDVCPHEPLTLKGSSPLSKPIPDSTDSRLPSGWHWLWGLQSSKGWKEEGLLWN